ncbi:hypothetical protein Lalb_Chr08g0246161 [Lupinus albus]|uniref:Uncharacterized protein n=1 Tax=Lupinus albus TaxID=3870 RepID=A0A6A4Q6D4_LUPAL|nr:hypothetical protein Lalb_Chr08g0246161 [Lupinus albus]
MASPSDNRFHFIPNNVSVPPMKKRNRESTLSDSEKVKGIETGEKDGIKNYKKSYWPTSEGGCGAITKDEEEVAETLFSLAGMFLNNESNASKTQPQCQSLPQDSYNATFQGTTQDASPCPEKSPSGAAKITSLNETFDQQQNDCPDSAKLLMAHSTDQKQPTPMIDKSENGSKVALHDSKLCLVMGLNVPRQSLNSQIGKQPDMEFETGIDSKQEEHVIKDQKENEGPALWLGLSSKASSGTKASYLQSSAAKAPGWLNASVCASKQDVMESCSSRVTIPKVVTYKKSWKSCAAHVHISHLIRSLEVSKGQVKKEGDVHKLQQMRVQHVSKCGVLKEVDNLNGMRQGISSAAGTFQSSTRSSNEAKNGITQQQSYHHDISQGTPTSKVYGPQNQSFNFLSLSSGSNGLKFNSSFNNCGSRLEPLSKYQVPYFQIIQQQHGLMPMPTPQNQYASTSYHDQHHVAGAQARLQQPHYYGGPLSGTDYSSTFSNKQQCQSFWAVQLAAPQGRSALNCNIVRGQYHNLQSGWHRSSAVSSCSQVIDPHCPEALGSKITSISEQQLFTLASSLHQSRTNGMNIHLPSVCEESRGMFHSSRRTPSLQLLCDERI